MFSLSDYEHKSNFLNQEIGLVLECELNFPDYIRGVSVRMIRSGLTISLTDAHDEIHSYVNIRFTKESKEYVSGYSQKNLPHHEAEEKYKHLYIKFDVDVEVPHSYAHQQDKPLVLMQHHRLSAWIFAALYDDKHRPLSYDRFAKFVEQYRILERRKLASTVAFEEI